MAKEILGIHHVTAIASDPQRNLDFYTGVLGLRLVKLTVNYDDPGSYHFYYGDEIGTPGTILTFFIWPGAPRGRQGTGQLTVTSFAVPENALHFWVEWLKRNDIEFTDPVKRFDENVLTLFDPDGLRLELVAHSGAKQAEKPWKNGPIPPQHAISGFYGVSLSEEGYESTAGLLTDTLGFRLTSELGTRFRYEVGKGGPGSIVDVLCLPTAWPGQVAAGTVHHVAYQTPNDDQQRQWRQELADLDYNVTPVIDRVYFHSIYFREPGGVLFEIATVPPGFTVDEPIEQLGTHLRLPPWLEPLRARLEAVLPQVNLRGAVGVS